MAKRDPRYPNGDRAVCLRCGAPGNANFKGAQLVLVKGLTAKRSGRAGKHRNRQYQHADPAFCRRRMDGVRRSPTGRDTRDARVTRP